MTCTDKRTTDATTGGHGCEEPLLRPFIAWTPLTQSTNAGDSQKIRSKMGGSREPEDSKLWTRVGNGYRRPSP